MPARDIAGDIWLCFLFIHCHSHRLFCVTILSYVLGSGRVTSDEIFAAICMYMLLGYGWTFVYSILLELQPGSLPLPTNSAGTITSAGCRSFDISASRP